MVALDNSLGALFIGVVAAAILYGFACLQTWYYYTQYSSDPWYIKLLVAAVLISETCSQALITHAIYTYLITNFGVWAEIENTSLSLVTSIFFSAFTTFLVQCFLAMRVYRLSNRRWLTAGSVMIFVIAEFFAAIILGIKAFGLHTTVEIDNTLDGLSMAVNALAATGDVLIAVFLCYLLWVSRTGFRKSDTMISKLIVFSINTGLLTSLCALAALVSITAWPHAFIYMTFYCCIDRLYCNSLLATLNARKRLRRAFYEDDMSLSFHGHGTQQKTNHSTNGTASKVNFSRDDEHGGVDARQRIPNNISIKIDTTHEYIQEEYSSPAGDVKNPEAV